MPTIKDIAIDSGISTVTISKYLSGKHVRDTSREKIEQSIRKLHYLPNAAAQSLRSSRSNTVCILTHDLGDYFWGEMCDYLQSYLKENNFFTIIRSFRTEPGFFEKEQSLFLDHTIDGVIIIPETGVPGSFLTLAREADIPCVMVDQIYDYVPADGVTSANRLAAETATRYLIERGHKKIAAIGSLSNSYTMSERLAGCRDAFEKMHLPTENLTILCDDFSPVQGRSIFETISSIAERPTALVTLGQNITMKVLLELRSNRLRIPEDFSLIAIDDDQIFAAYQPSITVLKQDLKVLASKSVELLLKRINKDMAGFPSLTKIPCHLIERHSVRDLRTQ